MHNGLSAGLPAVFGAEGARTGSGQSFTIFEPSTGEALDELAVATAEDVSAVVGDASAALCGPWRDWTPLERGRLLQRVARSIEAQGDRLAELVVADAGLPRWLARRDVEAAARYFEYYAGLADKLFGATIPLGRQFVDYTIREPRGVCAVILPFNVPLQMAARSIAPALLSGNTVVLKPAEWAPFAPLALCQICIDAGAPSGVVTALAGLGSEIGDPLIRDPRVDHVTFTGSLATGTRVMTAAAASMKPTLIELGGKSPQLVFADADLEAAATAIVGSALRTAGQACSAGTRVLVERSCADELTRRLVVAADALTVGPAADNPDVGPVISAVQRDRISAAVQRSIDEGAVRISRTDRQWPTEGYFVEPTVLAAKNPEVYSAKEEIFGPVVTVLEFGSDAEALEIANGNDLGLVAGVWTHDINRAHRLSYDIRAGQVFINNYGVGGGVELPFGGSKRSGFGRLKGIDGALEYTQIKNVCVFLG
ncbi:aldehyde dehydrogenase family protein [Jatrophihabitans sp. DSM 45814]